MWSARRAGAALAVLVLALSACTATAEPRAAETPTTVDVIPTPTPSTTPSPTPTPSATPTATTTPAPTAATSRSATPRATASPTTRPSSSCARVPARLSLAGAVGSAIAYAPLSNPADVTIEGTVSQTAAWSTSKVLIIAAFIDTVADGQPSKISAANRDLITRSMTVSDGTAVNRLRDQIPGSPGPAMTRVLRGIGDTRTVAPNSYQGQMSWTIREQVRFMAALSAGRVVSSKASAYLLSQMHPTASQSWGLGGVGASSFKGGWLRADTATRQMGILNGYAVAIITTRGPAVRQSDGDSAHVQQINQVARLLRDRLAWERAQPARCR